MQTPLTEQRLRLNIEERELFGQLVARYGRMFEQSLSPKSRDWVKIGDVGGVVFRIVVGDHQYIYGWQVWIGDPSAPRKTGQPLRSGEADSLRECLAEVMAVAFREYLQREMI